MNGWLWWSGIAAAGIMVVGALGFWAGATGWRRDTERAVEVLRQSARSDVDAPAAILSGEDLVSLPLPVQRYFAFALPREPARIRVARVRWQGEFRMRPDAGWVPFRADQHFTAAPPGFTWDASVRLFPLVPVRVRDGYQQGQGSVLGRIGGLIPVVDQGGSPEIAQSGLARWLGEAAWFPTALLPGRGVAWSAVDDSTARATVRDGSVSATAEFHFGPGGEIRRMTAMRFRDVDGAAVLTPFDGEYADYSRWNGMMVPGRAEVAWLLPEGRFAYWRGRPIDVRYGASPPARLSASP